MVITCTEHMITKEEAVAAIVTGAEIEMVETGTEAESAVKLTTVAMDAVVDVMRTAGIALMVV